MWLSQIWWRLANQARRRWETLFVDYARQYPDLAREIDQMQRRELPEGWDRNLPTFKADPKGIAGRDASGEVLNVLAQNIPWLLGGSADLGSSNKTTLKFAGAGDFEPGTPGGRNFHFGIREHTMGSIANGMVLSGLRPYTATFFIFTDYMRPPIRLDRHLRQPQPIPVPRGLSIHHPPRQLLQPGLQPQRSQRGKVEHPRLPAKRAVLLDQQRRLPRYAWSVAIRTPAVP